MAIATDMLEWDITWACMKIHGKDRCKPKLSVNTISPYVSIFFQFATSSVYGAILDFVLGSSGITLICAPVSTQNKYPVFLSQI